MPEFNFMWTRDHGNFISIRISIEGIYSYEIHATKIIGINARMRRSRVSCFRITSTAGLFSFGHSKGHERYSHLIPVSPVHYKRSEYFVPVRNEKFLMNKYFQCDPVVMTHNETTYTCRSRKGVRT